MFLLSICLGVMADWNWDKFGDDDDDEDNVEEGGFQKVRWLLMATLVNLLLIACKALYS